MLDRKLWISAVIWLFSVMFIVLSRKSKHLKKWTVLPLVYSLGISAFLSAMAIFVPVYSGETGSSFIGFANSIVSTAKLFAFDLNATEIRTTVFGSNAAINLFTEFYIFVISLYVPMVTVTAALTILNDTFTQLKYSLSFFSEAHIFSELNEKSICLANDIRKKDKHATIVFTSVDRIASEEAEQGLPGEAKEIHARMTKKPILSFHCLRLGRKKLNIYLIDYEETNNTKFGTQIASASWTPA